MEEVCHWVVGFEVSRAQSYVLSEYKPSATAPVPHLLVCHYAPFYGATNQPSETLCKAPIKCLLLNVALDMVSLHTNRIVTKILSRQQATF